MSSVPREDRRMSREEVTGTGGVAGERDVPIVHRVRSLQSRLSSLLAAGLMILLGVGLLTWYYTNAFARQARAREAQRVRAAARVQGDLPPPPLGRIDSPPGMPMAIRQSGSDLPLAHTAGPETEPAYVPPEAGLPELQPAKTPAQLALERELSGSVFAHESNPSTPTGSGALPEPVAAPQGPEGAPGPRGSGDLGPFLRPTATPAVAAQVLPTQRFLLPKGAFIDCTLETAIDSTLPGLTSCITATDTFGVDGKVVLLERGTKLVGETRGQVQQGAARLFVLWTSARTPAGVAVPLDSPGADELGRAGMPGDVDRHFWDRFGAAMLVSVLDGGVQAAVQSTSRGNGTVIYNPGESQGVLTEALKGTINIAPTLVKRNGDRIQVLVARDLDFRPVYELRSLGR
jgi:type IV secretion system protein VirB10